MNLATTCKNSWRQSAEIVDVHQQVVEPDEAWIVVLREGEGVATVEPTVVAAAAIFGVTDFEHGAN